jgi:hypothetical protein
MILKKTNNDFDTHPYLTKTIPQKLVDTLPLKDFDKDGYEVPALLERAYYEAQGIQLNHEIQYHIAPVKPWYLDEEDSEQELVLDHCMLLQRFALGGEAKLQVEETIEARPILQKLLSIKPKWGIDFSLDYVSKDIVMEVIHIEQDFDNLEQAQEAKMKLENIIEKTDWLDGAKQLIKRKAEWINLSSDDHSDYKAQFFGWHRAFDNLKVFSA